MARHEVAELIAVLGRWWEDPALTGLRRLRPSTRAGRVPAADDPYARDLGGIWSFRLLERPTDAPGGWTAAAPDGWDRITVPGCWTTQGFDDRPQYTNIVMPFTGDPPHVPADNPTGLYRTTFRRPAGWARRRTILHLDGAESCCAVWCNGAFVGIATDSRLASEFDLTEHVRSGVNELAVMVIRWSAHTWMEDQDHWYHAGLERRVYLRSVPPVALADVRLTAGLGAAGAGRLTVAAIVDWGPRLADPTVGYQVRARIARASGAAPVSVLDVSSHVAAHLDAYRHPGPRADLDLRVPGVRAWSHEDPQRYPVTVELLDPSGAVVDEYETLVGFRSVEIRGAELLLNGVPLLIAGVNRHDHHPVTGKTLTDLELRDDLCNIKRCGFNAVRTSHYPPDPVVLDTCDEIGLWVVLEANVETHARIRELAHDRRFEHQYLERVQRAVQTHWNHPAIIGWSLGNEAGYGAAHAAGAAWVRATDPSRFVHYEGAAMDRWRGGAFVREWPDAQGAGASDVECPMYAPVERLIEWATQPGGPDKPLILCEYSHAMGNSNGGLADYWAAFEQHHGLQGGFIWDWKDQAFAMTDDANDPEGRPYWGYGGVFGDDPNDSVFCDNGMVNANGVPRPAVEEHRWLTRPIHTAVVGRTLRITNRRAFSGTADLVGTVTIAVDGVEHHRETLDPLDIAPGATARIKLRKGRTILGGERVTTVTWALRKAAAWAPRGHVVAWDQGYAGGRYPDDVPGPEAEFVPAFDGPRNGGIFTTGIHVPGDVPGPAPELGALLAGVGLDAAPRLALWRAPLDNDGIQAGPFAGLSDPLRRWRRWGLDRLTTSEPELRGRGGAWEISTTWTTAAGHPIEHLQRITPRSDGRVNFFEDVRIPAELSDLPRVGVWFALPAAHDRLRWYGRGPWETMPDRANAPLGVWSAQVAEQLVDYPWPQHHGSHVDTRWFELTDRRGRGVRAELDSLTFDASPYAVEQLTEARTLAELRPSDRVYARIDAALRGAGTGACGPDTTAVVKPGRYRFAYTLQPLP
jgi:beta-galactosidase